MQKQWLQRAITISALILLISGLWYALKQPVFASWQQYQGAGQSLPVTSTAAADMSLQEPVLFEIPRLAIRLDVKPGAYDNASKTWTLNGQNAFFTQGVATPMLYGHDIPAVFQPLAGAAPNELLVVTEQNGTKQQFRYVSDKIVAPDDRSIVTTKLDNTLLVMTCEGAFSQSRRVMYFTYVGEAQ